jgi:hypothetical protein
MLELELIFLSLEIFDTEVDQVCNLELTLNEEE